MMNPRLVFGSIGFAVVVTMAIAKTDVPNPHWLTKSDIQALVKGEQPPPQPGTDADKTDMQGELAAQSSRTDAQIAEAKRDEGYSVALFTGPIPNVTPQNDPKTFAFFDRVNKQIGEVVNDAKDHWKKPRPYQAHPDLIHPLFQAGGFSYPSGHSTHSYAFALILGQVFPEHAQEFLDRAHQIAQSRVDAGVHYPTDIKEGEVLGHKIANELLANPEFQKELAAAKAEVAAKK